MKRALLLALLLAPSACGAQQPFEPFTVTQQDFAAITTYLADQPFKFSEPVMAWLRQKEAAAIEAKKAEPAKPKDSP